MRIDENLMIFLPHKDWYIHVKGVGYVPTDKAPKEAVEAGADFLVIGRPITGHADPVEAARLIAAEMAEANI